MPEDTSDPTENTNPTGTGTGDGGSTGRVALVVASVALVVALVALAVGLENRSTIDQTQQQVELRTTAR
jgi:hypothetical protein